jgi:TolB-like protein/Tfp pilus assembly protein PilF
MDRLRDLTKRMGERKLVQWVLAYLAGAWAFAQAFDLVAEQFGWPMYVRQGMTLLLAVGLAGALVIAWYHGEKGRQRVSGPELLALALLFCIAGLLVSRLDAGRETVSVTTIPADSPQPRVRPAVAVLPFANISGDSLDVFFTDGIHEEIILRLSRVGGLDVIARTSVMQYRDRSQGAREIARELNVTALLGGSVRRAGRRVRITAELIAADGEVAVWSDSWERELQPDSLFAVQEQIARSVAAALDAQLTRDEDARLAVRPTHDLQAYDYYLLGRQRWARRSPASLREALSLFEAAIDRDPTYAPARAGIADTWAVLAWYDTVPPATAYPRARDAAFAALELDPDLAEPHATLGLIAHEFDGDWSAAETNFRDAIRLRPNYASAHHWYAILLSNLGRHEEAIEEAERALALDPFSTVVSGDVAGVFWTAGLRDRAIALLDRALDRDSVPPPGVELERAIILLYESLWDRAEISLVRWARLAGYRSPDQAGEIARAARGATATPGALAILGDIENRGAATREDLIPLYALLGDRRSAIEGVERAERGRSPWLVWMGTLPWYDSLRAEPRFRDVLERARLPNGRQ